MPPRWSPSWWSRSRAPANERQSVPGDVAAARPRRCVKDFVVGATQRVDGGAATGDVARDRDPCPAVQTPHDAGTLVEHRLCPVDLEGDESTYGIRCRRCVQVV